MPKLYSSKEITRVLFSKGFVFNSQRGSHLKFRKITLTVIVPADKREIPIGTFKSILRQSGLTAGDFI